MKKPITRYRMAIFIGLGAMTNLPILRVTVEGQEDPWLINGIREISFNDDGSITRFETVSTVYVQVK